MRLLPDRIVAEIAPGAVAAAAVLAGRSVGGIAAAARSLAALVAAALSSLGSAVNATSSTAVTDFYQQYIKPDAEPAHYVRISRIVTMGIGGIVIGVALLCADFSAHHPEIDLLSIALGIMTFFYGVLGLAASASLFSITWRVRSATSSMKPISSALQRRGGVLLR